jgi:hypothetical protein
MIPHKSIVPIFILLFYALTIIAIVIAWILVFQNLQESPMLKVLLSSAITVIILLIACGLFFIFVMPPWRGID